MNDPRTGRQRAAISLSPGPVRLKAKVDVTRGGLLAVGVLVSSILLSTAVLVRVAKQGRPPRG